MAGGMVRSAVDAKGDVFGLAEHLDGHPITNTPKTANPLTSTDPILLAVARRL